MPGHFEADGDFEKGTGDTLDIPECTVNIGGFTKGFRIAPQTDFNPVTSANRDSSFTALAVGDDIKLYALALESSNAQLMYSKNSTYPTGTNADGAAITADNSRKIAGFHYGRTRTVLTAATIAEGILENSIWDLRPGKRPICDPSGLAKVGNHWQYIYLASVDEAIVKAGDGYPVTAGTCKSVFGGVPLTGTEGLAGYNFVELAKRSNARLLTHAEWLQGAHGHPQGDEFVGNTSDRGTCGDINLAVSFSGIVDCARKVFQWVDEYTIAHGTDTWAYYDVMPSMKTGQLYLPNATGLRQFITGGRWNSGANAGSRLVSLGSYPWNVDTSLGSRFACDTL